MCVFFVRLYTPRTDKRSASIGYFRVWVLSGICRIGNRIPRKDPRNGSSILLAVCSSEIQVDGAVDLTGTTARLYRDYHKKWGRKWGQVQRGVPSNSIAFRVAALFYPSILKTLGPSKKERRRYLIPLNFLLFCLPSHNVFSVRFLRNCRATFHDQTRWFFCDVMRPWRLWYITVYGSHRKS